jgi:hypothetical protein
MQHINTPGIAKKFGKGINYIHCWFFQWQKTLSSGIMKETAIITNQKKI